MLTAPTLCTHQVLKEKLAEALTQLKQLQQQQQQGEAAAGKQAAEGGGAATAGAPRAFGVEKENAAA